MSTDGRMSRPLPHVLVSPGLLSGKPNGRDEVELARLNNDQLDNDGLARLQLTNVGL